MFISNTTHKGLTLTYEKNLRLGIVAHTEISGWSRSNVSPWIWSKSGLQSEFKTSLYYEATTLSQTDKTRIWEMT